MTRGVIYPDRCCLCGALQTENRSLCPDCEKLRLPVEMGGARCPVCGLRLSRCVCGDRLCFETLTFPFYYEGRVRHALHRMKFFGCAELIFPFAKEMVSAAKARGSAGTADLVAFVPMRPFAAWRRGYNQAEELAKGVGTLLELPVLPLLRKTEKTEPQHDLPLYRRRGNLLGVFEPAEKYKPKIEGGRVLLVDDIHTSGNTLNEAAKTLMLFGAERVDCLCFAATPRDGDGGFAPQGKKEII